MEILDDKICLDTDVLVNFLRNKKEETEFIRQNEHSMLFATTPVTLFELYYGAYKSGVPENVLRVDELQHKLAILNLSREAVKLAGKTLADLNKKGVMLDFRDLLIGCTAITEGFCLKTNNRKHFEKFQDLIIK